VILLFPPTLSLDKRTEMYDIISMNGKELLRKIKKLAKERGKNFEIFKGHGKGSHGTLKYGENKTTIKDPKKEIGPGLLKKMLAQLNIDKDDL